MNNSNTQEMYEQLQAIRDSLWKDKTIAEQLGVIFDLFCNTLNSANLELEQKGGLASTAINTLYAEQEQNIILYNNSAKIIRDMMAGKQPSVH